MFFKCFILALLAAAVCARSTSTNQNSIQDEARSEETTSYYGDLRFLYKVYQECAASDLSSCLKMKLVTALDRMAKSYTDVSVFEGISFVKNPNAKPAELKTEKDIEATLPRSLDERDNALNTMITDRISNFFESHTLQVKLPSLNDMQRSLTDEARKKKKGGGGAYMILPLILGGTLIPLALGALALLAGKALIVSKLALVLAGIIGLKKLLGGGGSHGSEQVVVGGHSSGGWGRSYNKEEEQQNAQKLAYSAYAQKSR